MECLAGCQATGHLLSRSISILLKTPGDKRGSELTALNRRVKVKLSAHSLSSLSSLRCLSIISFAFNIPNSFSFDFQSINVRPDSYTDNGGSYIELDMLWGRVIYFKFYECFCVVCRGSLNDGTFRTQK